MTRGGKAKPQKGSLEVLGQLCRVSWWVEDALRKLNIFFSPVILENTASGCLYQGCEAISQTLNLEGLRTIGQKVKCFFLSEILDNAGSCGRKKAFYARSLPRNCFYDGARGCSTHRVKLIIDTRLGETRMVGIVHAVSYVTSLPAHVARVYDVFLKKGGR